MDVSEDKKCSFRLSVKRGKFWQAAQQQFVNPLQKLQLLFADAVFDSGSVYIQVGDENNHTTSYFYDQKFTGQKNTLPKIFGAMAGIFCLDRILDATHTSLPWPVGIGMLFGIPFLSAMTGKGIVKRTGNEPKPHLTLQAPITRERYRALRRELDDLVERDHHGIYCGPFNNCATFATKFAKDHGFRIDAPFYNTPRNLIDLTRKRGPQAFETMELTG